SADNLTVAQPNQFNPGQYFAPAIFPDTLPAAGTAFLPQCLTRNDYQCHARVDYVFSTDKDRMFFDWFRTYSDQLQSDPRVVYQVKVPNNGIYGKINWVHTFSPTVLTEASFTGVRPHGSNP